MTRLPLSPQAHKDLDEIAAYISKNYPRAAVRLIDALMALCHRVCETPLGYPSCEDIRVGLRRAVYRPYLLFFIVDQNGVRIERIVHGARDLPALFDPKA